MDGTDSKCRESSSHGGSVSSFMRLVGIALYILAIVFVVICFIGSVSFLYGVQYPKALFMYPLLLAFYLDRVRKEGFRLSAAFSAKVLRMSFFARLQAFLVGVSTLVHAIYWAVR